MKVLCSQEVVRPYRCGVVLCQGTAQASAPQVPWCVLACGSSKAFGRLWPGQNLLIFKCFHVILFGKQQGI